MSNTNLIQKSTAKVYDLGHIGSIKLFRAIQRNDLSVLTRIANEHELSCIRIGSKKMYYPATVEQMHFLLHMDQRTLVKSPKVQKYVAEAIGKGLISTDMGDWVERRKEVKGIFSPRHINSLIETIGDAIDKRIQKSDEIKTLNQLFDAVSIEVMGKVFFGGIDDDDSNAIKNIVSKLNEVTFKKIMIPFPVFTDPLNRIVPVAREKLFKIITRYINFARNSPSDNLIKQYYPTGDKTEDISNIFLAGFETTSNSLFWFFYEILRNKEVMARMHDEVASDISYSNYEELKLKIPFTVACVDETLRLYPPIWIMSRTTTEATGNEYMHYPKDTEILLSPFVFHRMDKYWNNPDVFNPSRFLNHDEKTIDHKPSAYMPFGFGARACIGEKLALLEMYLVIIAVFRNFQLSAKPQEIHPLAHFTLRPPCKINININRQHYGKQLEEI